MDAVHEFFQKLKDKNKSNPVQSPPNNRKREDPFLFYFEASMVLDTKLGKNIRGKENTELAPIQLDGKTFK